MEIACPQSDHKRAALRPTQVQGAAFLEVNSVQPAELESNVSTPLNLGQPRSHFRFVEMDSASAEHGRR
jgi:hypothetical protein